MDEQEEQIVDQADDNHDDCQKRCDELDHKYKLALADYQNLLKQTAKERIDLAMYANEALILELLPVYDNLKLTLVHYPSDGDKNWLIGLQHVIQQFKKTLEDNGIKEIETKDKKFDHNLMEAVETTDSTDKKLDETVANELKGGYLLHDKVIIPARVSVYKISAKGGSAPGGKN
ncbi:MAG: nucleotide exchange factor GrpE [Candidatus Falkowbacteria bacterium]|nr:nucleotide exchange factor GrpE [Candidatus Falkowbacteria bacterium]